jgi:hypothetical protein
LYLKIVINQKFQLLQIFQKYLLLRKYLRFEINQINQKFLKNQRFLKFLLNPHC